MPDNSPDDAVELDGSAASAASLGDEIPPPDDELELGPAASAASLGDEMPPPDESDEPE